MATQDNTSDTYNPAVDISISGIKNLFLHGGIEQSLQTSIQSSVEKAIAAESRLSDSQRLELLQLADRVGQQDIQDAISESYSDLQSQIQNSLDDANVSDVPPS